MKVRYGQKVTQDYVLEFLKTFIYDNESLIHLDVSNTGLDGEGIIDLVTFLKEAQDEEAQPQKLRNLACIHMSQLERRQQLDILPEIYQILDQTNQAPILEENKELNVIPEVNIFEEN